MKDLNYSIYLEPDLKNFIFKGITTIKFVSDVELEKIELNAKELGVFSCIIIEDENNIECSFTYKPNVEKLIIDLNEKKKGMVSLKIEYSGILNDSLLGFYRSKYESDGKMKYNAVTQFEERFARKCFPCFDHPSKKATFDVEFLIDKELQGISNTQIIQENEQENGKKLVKFDTTPIMSTYLLFFGVGDYRFLEDKSKLPIVRTVAVPDKIKYGQYGLEMGRKSLDWMEKYTKIDFPIKKCDFIAVSDFAFGAMENFGAITFRENALLFYPGETSKPQLTRIAEVIAHETAHMWFGDLVSPSEWKYIWLNESFASYFTVEIPDFYYPEWSSWDNFTLDSTLEGMERDSLINTIPIELPGDKEARIDHSTAPIIYNKGAAIIRMLVGYLGKEHFQKAVNFFLKKFSYKCANSDDYWDAFEKSTGEPIKIFADSWIHQKGFPLIEVKIHDNEYIFSQERFTYSKITSSNIWHIPINLIIFYDDKETEIKHIVLKEKELKIDVPIDAISIKLNQEQDSFYRVKYPENILNSFGKLILKGKIPYIERFGIENDLFSLIKRGDLKIKDYLAYIENYYIKEINNLVLTDILRNLISLYLGKISYRDQIKEIGVRIFKNKLDLLGFQPRKNDTLQDATLRNNLIWILHIFGVKEVNSFGLDQFQLIMEGKTIHIDILSSILRIGSALNPDAKKFLTEMIFSEKIPEINKLYAIRALGSSPNKQDLLEFLDLGLTKIPKKNRIHVIGTISRNFYAIPWLWEWFRDNFNLINESLPEMHLDSTLPLVIKYAGIGFEDEVKIFLKKVVTKNPTLEASAEMAIEFLEIFSKLE